MDVRACWEILKGLLDRLPEVRVVHSSSHPKSIYVSSYVGSRSSLLALARCSAGANTALRVESKDNARRHDVPAPGDDELRYVMYLEVNRMPELGIYVLRELVNQKLIDSLEATELEEKLQRFYRIKGGYE